MVPLTTRYMQAQKELRGELELQLGYFQMLQMEPKELIYQGVDGDTLRLRSRVYKGYCETIL